MVHIKNTKSG